MVFRRQAWSIGVKKESFIYTYMQIKPLEQAISGLLFPVSELLIMDERASRLEERTSLFQEEEEEEELWRRRAEGPLDYALGVFYLIVIGLVFYGLLKATLTPPDPLYS